VGERTPALSRSVSIIRSRDAQIETATDRVAEEAPISLRYNGVPHVVMMATPADLEDLAVGFTVTESVATATEIRSVAVSQANDGVHVDLHVAAERFAELLQRQRNLTGRTGCGVCGVTTIDDAIRTPNRCVADMRVTSRELHTTLLALSQRQKLNRIVGSVHGAAWARAKEGIEYVREDVGRHNALDKTIGALLREKTDPASGYLVITSRASYEMVLKAAMVGVSLLVAVSAPTALAIDLAAESGMTLIGFAREHSHVIYSHPERVVA
jgi:formate dehydrogenase accessory protein FdhD